jgi:hypothetical protein
MILARNLLPRLIFCLSMLLPLLVSALLLLPTATPLPPGAEPTESPASSIATDTRDSEVNAAI